MRVRQNRRDALEPSNGSVCLVQESIELVDKQWRGRRQRWRNESLHRLANSRDDDPFSESGIGTCCFGHLDGIPKKTIRSFFGTLRTDKALSFLFFGESSQADDYAPHRRRGHISESTVSIVACGRSSTDFKRCFSISRSTSPLSSRARQNSLSFARLARAFDTQRS